MFGIIQHLGITKCTIVYLLQSVIFLFRKPYMNINKCWRISKRQSKMDNQEKRATQGTQDEDKQNVNTSQYVLDNTMGK